MFPVCPNCRSINPTGMHFCGNCGTRLPEGTSSETKFAGTEPDASHPWEAAADEARPLSGERFSAATLKAEGQRRHVTILSVSLIEYEKLTEQLPEEDWYELVRRFHKLMANNVYKYEGAVEKFTTDGLIALFGAPNARENNAELAIRSALDMQADMARFSQSIRNQMGINLGTRIGLQTGQVIVGNIGTDQQVSYTIIGDAIQAAQRINEAAQPGCILVSESVYHQTDFLIEYQEMAPVALKENGKSIPGFQVRRLKSEPGAARGKGGLRAPMVGRDLELEQLQKAVQVLQEQHTGQLLFITGEAGIGKSRLVAELKARTDPAEMTILESQGRSYQQAVSYWMFLDLLYDYLEVSPETQAEEIHRKLLKKGQEVLKEQAVKILPFIEHLMALKLDQKTGGEYFQYLEPAQSRQQIFLALRDLLTAAASQRPLLLIFEDLHWADQPSLDLLQFLLDSLHHFPILILAVSRPFDSGRLLRLYEWARKYLNGQYATIALQSLSPDQSELLLNQFLAIPDFPKDLRENILQRAAGIPFYLEEILRMLIDDGFIQRENGAWRLVDNANIATLGVPATIQDLILARFDRLDPIERRILQIASVIGNQFSLPLLNKVLMDEENEIEEAFALLVSFSLLIDRNFIISLSEKSGSDYIFKHVLMSEAFYNTLLKPDRSEIHRRVGQAIEVIYADRIDEQVELLAKHYSRSARLDRALYYQILAGHKAAGNYDHAQAKQYYEQALELLPQLEHSAEQKLQIQMGLGDILVFVGEYLTAQEHYQAALASISAEPDKFYQERSKLQRKMATTSGRLGEYQDALRYLEEALQSLGEAGGLMPYERAQILSEIGWIQSQRGNLEQAEEQLVRALALVENSPYLDITASIYNRLGGVYYQKAQLDQASNFVWKSLVLREQIGDTAAVARSYNNLGLLAWQSGNWKQALENFNRSLEGTKRLGDVEGTILLNINLGLLLMDQGELEEARQHLEDSLNSAVQIGHSYLEGNAYYHLSRYWLAANEWEKSLDFSRHALKVFAEIGVQDKEILVDLYASLGEAWLKLGNLEQASQAGLTGQQLLGESDDQPGDPSPERGRIFRLLGNIARVQGEWETAKAWLDRSADDFNSLGERLEFGRTLVAMAVLSQELGDLAAYRHNLDEALSIFQQLGARLDLQSVR